MPYPQARYWLLTIPQHAYLPYLPPDIAYVKGQLECGHDTGYLHWQLLVISKRKLRLAGIKLLFGQECHAEPTRSNAAEDYVWKEDTRVTNTQFELGTKPFQRNNPTDWEKIRNCAKTGQLADVPGDIFIRYYGNLKRIAADYCEPLAMERNVTVFWGPTGVGKSRRAWDLAGINAYPKDPRTKFWDGYRNQECVVMDEFRGDIDIAHLLRWFDRYPCIVEVKGSSVVLQAKTFYITSNLCPENWFPNLDIETKQALLRRLTVIHCDNPLNFE